MPVNPKAFARFPLVAHLPEDQREVLRTAGSRRAVRRGAVLFQEGDPADALYGVLEGRVKLVRTSPEGRELFLRLVREGETFAEASLFGRDTLPVGAIALVDSQLWVLDRTRLLGLIEAFPELALGMLASISRRAHHLVAQIDSLTRRSVEERLAAYLVEQASRQPIEVGDVIRLDDPRHLIAAQIGTAPEVLSRTLRRMEDEGVARFAAHETLILDPVRLRELAGHSGG